MPDMPVVTIFVADYLKVIRWPLPNYRYQEWCVLLKSVWNGDKAWYALVIPVSRWLAKVSGVYLGFPKYIADEISQAVNGETRLAIAKYKGVTQLTLEYHPGINRPLVPWERELMDNESFFKGDGHLLVPAGRGPRAQKIILRHVIQPKWSPEPGMVHVRVDSGESWAGLIPAPYVFPGTYNHFTGGMNLLIDRRDG